ncbi:MAG: hypothetical protein OXC60_14645 [Litoreibacter sp.]|nr:hypothetical protein [Litoreibacter sp.]MCY4335894.1 hypothetical protein [Litoreibacter sp.]
MTRTNIWTILTAGAFATLAFDLFGQGLSPMAGFAKLAPVGLAQATIKSVFGAAPKGIGDVVHIVNGLLIYSLGYVLVARPIQQKIMPNLHWLITSIVYGVGLWVFALYGVAHLIAGNKPFLGFTGITWVALWGHILYGVVVVYMIEKAPFAKKAEA